MKLKPDFKDLLRLFNHHQVTYLTRDIDLRVEPTPENAKRTYAALVEFGAPMADLTFHDLTQPHIVFQFGMAPARVDVMTTIDAVTFADGWKSRGWYVDADVPRRWLSRSKVRPR